MKKKKFQKFNQSNQFLLLQKKEKEKEKPLIQLEEKEEFIVVTSNDLPLPENQRPIEIMSFSDRIVSSVEGTTSYLSSSINSGTKKIGFKVKETGVLIKTKMESSEIQIPTIVKWGINGVESIVTSMSTYSGNAINNVINTSSNAITGGVARITNWLPDHPSENFRTMRRIGIKSVKHVGNLVGEVTDSFKNVIYDTSETTLDVIKHKFGEDVSNLTKSSVNITKGAVETYFNVSGISAQAVALVAAKNATFEIMETVEKK